MRLGYIHEVCQGDYLATSFSETECYEAVYARESMKDEVLNIIHNSQVEFLRALKNRTGSGYIINQSKVLDGGRLIVHSRGREVCNDEKSRISIIVRIRILDKMKDDEDLDKIVI